MSELKKIELLRENLRVARLRYPSLLPSELKLLSDLTRSFRLSLSKGEIMCIDGKWYVTYGGLLRIAFRRHCKGILTVLQERQSDPLNGRWIFKATVYKSRGSRGFTGYGDADPTNVSSLVLGAEMRVAETRAVNRALRKAYGIGLCSVEELDAIRVTSKPAVPSNGTHSSNGNGQPRLRDQLCLAIRRFKLDPNLVKSYAADFCGTDSLSEASRESVQAFIDHLNKAAEENRDALVCKLNSFASRMEAQS